MGTNTLTLAELKANNAAEQETVETKDEYIEVNPDTDEPINNEANIVEEPVTDEVEPDKGEGEEADDGEAVDEALEDWQKSEEDEVSKDSKKKGFVPNAGFKKLRQKLKDSKANGEEKDSRIDELQAEIEQLKVSSTPGKAEVALPPRPKMEDSNIDYDQDKLDRAMDEWQDLRMDRKMSTHTDSLQKERLAKAQYEARIQKTDKAVTGHLERAATLIEGGKITEDKWLSGDMKIRQALETFIPEAGDKLADQFITLLSENGADSEKVWYYLGNNEKALSEFTSKVVGDPSGASAVMYLAGIQNKFTQSANKKRSGAPKPATKLKGDAVISGGKVKKKYDDAIGDPQVRINLKRTAKSKGIDVSKW